MGKTKTIVLDLRQREYLYDDLLKKRNNLRNKQRKANINHKEVEEMILCGQIINKLSLHHIAF